MAQGGVPAYQRALAGEVRDLTLKEIKAILIDKNHETFSRDFRQQVILKLAGNVLPRLNEHTGEDGEKLFPSPILSNIIGKRDENNKQGNTISEAENL